MMRPGVLAPVVHLVKTLLLRPAFHGALEAPSPDAPVSGLLRVAGWAFSRKAPVARVEALLDGRPLGPLRYGLPRGDVARAFPWRDVGRPGFEGWLTLDPGGAGPKMLVVRAVDDDGNAREYRRRVIIGTSRGQPRRRRAAVAIATATPLIARLDQVIDGVRERLVRSLVPGKAGGDGTMGAPADEYAALSARARDLHASRIARLPVHPPALIRIPEGDDLGGHAVAVRLAPEEAPEVSIVVPVFNNVRLTIECLLSVTRHTADVPFEVVVFDDGSTDETPKVLSAIPNLVYLRGEETRGFGPACNEAARAARGRYLVFLNNDAQVTPAWLSPLVRTFEEVEQVGAVGPKVLFPDGRLQEAGAGIHPDGASSLIGVSDSPELARFNYRREVDYLSGVCLTVEAGRFRQLGGFDAGYAPAYGEDVDLCLRLRALGLSIVYNPAAVIVHHLSATSATLDAGFKRRQVTRNQQRLAERHQAQIDALGEVRVIAFYLPQYHPIPENDRWWGTGFTEWSNVARARPNFAGHDQPRLPADLGFYDLRLREAYAHQVELAERYGVSGFCFYYYWFGGRRLLERPLERLVEDPGFTFPFCVAWANENWTRRWDGQEQEVLIGQSYSDQDDVAVIRDLVRYLRHPAYIRVNGRPLLLVYRIGLFPDIRKTARTWRAECRAQGIGEIYLALVETFELALASPPPQEVGFDASVEFPPHGAAEASQRQVAPGRVLNPSFHGLVFDYGRTALQYMTSPLPGHTRFRTVMPGWDNTARRQDDPHVFVGSTPGAYQAWLEWILRQTREQNFGDERIVFVNAWNEWAEGAYLEPDLRWGHAYLEATRTALDMVRLGLG